MIGITGATGLVGFTLCKHLLDFGFALKLFVRNPKDDILQDLDAIIIQGDLNDLDALDHFCKNVHTIIHVAALVSIFKKDKKQIFDTNINGVQNLIDASLKNQVKRFIHFSSIHAHEAYGRIIEIDEKTPYSNNPEIFYDYSKAKGEEIVKAARVKGLNTIIVNPTAIIGPVDHKPSYTGKMLIQLYRGELPVLVKGGFDWVDVRDICQAISNILEKNLENEKLMLSGQYHALSQIARWVGEFRGSPYKGLAIPIWIAKIGLPFVQLYSIITQTQALYTYASLKAIQDGSENVQNKKAVQLLDFKPIPTKQTIMDTLAWFKANNYLDD